ncbi:PREDICTED: uncharacterized protein LOC104749154 [Camelina sativa]|uniref:Uncharacterized protein LOC104749154 n=1 Tax=Camelina sativa TaxID=90675 RepID=A0ABM1QFK4_CAMSA|nr:PREDICTED: uncharacterized protein LOC104749154 [Camelina sativa]
MGDFNQILSADEHYSVIPYTLLLPGMSEFRGCLEDNELSDMPSRETLFMWFNGQHDDPIMRKLDWAVVNDVWCSKFPEAVAIFESPGDSDHSPCLVHTSSVVQHTKKPFKYFSFLSTHTQFQSRIKEAWQREVCAGSKLYTLGQRLKITRLACRRLNREGFGNIQQRTKEALEHLEQVQAILMSTPSDENFRQEWYKDGDANTFFFHRTMIANQGKNCIKFLRGADEDLIHNADQIKDMILAYYQGPLGIVNDELEPMSIEEIKDLTSFRCGTSLGNQLLQVPTPEDIRRTIASMPKIRHRVLTGSQSSSYGKPGTKWEL